MFARAATRATAAALPANAARQALIRRQNVSLMRSLRDFARGFEPHPFQRLPVASNPAPADYGKLVKRISQQLVVYAPSPSPCCLYCVIESGANSVSI